MSKCRKSRNIHWHAGIDIKIDRDDLPPGCPNYQPLSGRGTTR
jgi:hypothetical protein